MVEMGKKTGGHFLFEPLRTELQDTFGALSHVSPDAVFSNINGHENNPNSLSDEEMRRDWRMLKQILLTLHRSQTKPKNRVKVIASISHHCNVCETLCCT